MFHVASQSWLPAIDEKILGKCVRFIQCRANSKYLAAVIGLAHEKAKAVIIDLQALKNGQIDVLDLNINFQVKC